MKVTKVDNVIQLGKCGKDSVRLEGCKALKGKEFDGKDRRFWNTALQVTKGKVQLADGSTVGKMKMLGVIALGLYKGKATVIQLPKTDGHDRIDFAVKLLNDCKVDWKSIESVGSLSK